MKKLIFFILLFLMKTSFCYAGAYTANNYFYKPTYLEGSASAAAAQTAVNTFNTAFDVADAAIAQAITLRTTLNAINGIIKCNGTGTFSAVTDNSTNWNTAYGWGNHASAGYITGNQTITLGGDASGSGTTSISVAVSDDSHAHTTTTISGLTAADIADAWIKNDADDTSSQHIYSADVAYSSDWNGSTRLVTANSVYDKIETLGGGTGDMTKAVYDADANDAVDSADMVYGTNISGDVARSDESDSALISYNLQDKDYGEITWASGSATLDDSTAVTSWNLTTPTITTSLTTDSKTISEAEIGILDAGIEGTEVLSTGEAGGTKFLREDGDGTCSWQAVSAGAGDMTKAVYDINADDVVDTAEELVASTDFGDVQTDVNGGLVVDDDSHNHTTTTVSGLTSADISDSWLLNAGDVGTGVFDFGGTTSFEIPNDAAPTTDSAGEIALDTTVTDHQPLLQYYDGGENMTVIAIDTAQLPAEDNEIVKYDAGTDKFVLEADAGGSGSSAKAFIENIYFPSPSLSPTDHDDSYPALTLEVGTNADMLVLAFDATDTEGGAGGFRVPSYIDSTDTVIINITGYLSTADTADTVVTQLDHIARTNNESWDTAMTKTNLGTLVNSTTQNQIKIDSTTYGVSTLGWLGGDWIQFEFQRAVGDSRDEGNGDWDFIGIGFEFYHYE